MIETVIGVALGVAAIPIYVWNKLRNEKRNDRVRRVLSTFAAECANKGYRHSLVRGGTLLVVFRNNEEVLRIDPEHADIEAYIATLDVPDLSVKK